MPTVSERITKILYTPTEIELSPKIEEIIFKINLQSEGEFTRGAKFSEIKIELEKMGLHYSDEFLVNLFRKLKSEYILQEIDEEWYSCLM